MGRKGWTRFVVKQNRFYRRDRYFFVGALLFSVLLFLFYFSARAMDWIADEDLLRMFPLKRMKVLFVFEAFFFGLESEKKHFLIRTRIMDPMDENKYIQSHLNAMPLLRMHAFDFGAFHRSLLLRRMPAILIYMGGAALFVILSPGESYKSEVIGFMALILLMIVLGSELWFRTELYLQNKRGLVSMKQEPAERYSEVAIFGLEGAIWCFFFMTVGVFFSNFVAVHLNAIHYYPQLVRRREDWAFGWLLAAVIIHVQAHLKGERQLRFQRALVAVLIVADLLFFLPL